MGLFFNEDINTLFVGGTEVSAVYMGSTKVWPVGLPVGTVFNFEYTGTVQEVELPAGKYKLQCWGAQGGNVTGTYAVNGSKGGYSEGVLTLDKKTKLYVFVGGQGTAYTSAASQTSTTVVNGGWNGGGAGVRTSRYNSGDTDGRSFPRGGGGATDISTVTSVLSYSSGRTTRDAASLLARCIVAGGGAGASARYTVVTKTETNEVTLLSGEGDEKRYINASGEDGYLYLREATFSVSSHVGKNVKISINAGTNTYYVNYIFLNSAGSTITKDQANAASKTWTVTIPSGTVSLRLQAQNTKYTAAYPTYMNYTVSEVTSTTSTSTDSGKSSTAQQGGGTSGKGQYPGIQTSAGSGGEFGLGASQSSTNYRYCAGGGGGGWYGGGTNKSDSSTSYVNYSGGGSGFVNTAANAASRPSGYTGLQLDSGTTTAGNTSHPSTSGGTETGHSGNGYARITVLS